MDRIAYVNGEFVPLKQASISILDRGFLFADGIYEVSAVLDGRLVDNDVHLARLSRSAAEIRLVLPASASEIARLQRDLIARNSLIDGVIYLQVTRGSAERAFPFPADGRPTMVMFTQAKNLVEARGGAEGVSVKTVEDIRWARRDIKTVGLLAQVLSKQIAVDAECDEAWMVENGVVTEGASSSAFIITHDDVLVSRPDSHAILPGCTARAVMQLAKEAGLGIERRSFTVVEAIGAKEAFMTSASTLVQSVIRIDGQRVDAGEPGALTRRLRELYIGFARGR